MTLAYCWLSELVARDVTEARGNTEGVELAFHHYDDLVSGVAGGSYGSPLMVAGFHQKLFCYFLSYRHSELTQLKIK